MSVNFLLKRTATADKRPTAAQLDVGELAMNYAADDPGIFLEDNSGAVRKIGPTTVSATAPNASPAGQSGNSTGEMWLDTTDGGAALKVYNGTEWKTSSIPGLVTETSSTAITIDSSNRVGIGTTSPSTLLHLSADGANSARLYLTQANATTDGVDVTGYRSRGTVASPESLQNGDTIFKFFAQAHTGSGFVASGNMGWTASDGSGNSTFSLKTRVGSSMGDRITVDSTGDINILGNMDVSGNVSFDNSTLYIDASNNRIGIGTTSPSAQLSLASHQEEGCRIYMNQAYDGVDGTDINGFRSRGNLSTPTALQADDRIHSTVAHAHDGSEFIETGFTTFYATDGSGNGRWDLATRVSGSLTTRLSVTSTGTVSAASGLSIGTTGSPFQASAANDAVTKSYADSTYSTGFGIQAHAAWDASAAGSFDYSTDKISEGNITSVTRTATGKFTVTFDSDFDSANYTAICTAGALDHAGMTAGGRTVAVLSRSAGSMDIVVERADDGANDDCPYISVMVIGTLA